MTEIRPTLLFCVQRNTKGACINNLSASSGIASIDRCRQSAIPCRRGAALCFIRPVRHSRSLSLAHLLNRRELRKREQALCTIDMALQQLEDTDFVWENPDTPPTPSDYIFINGKRLVRPYFFEFIAHVKKRWAGKTVVDLFAHEFRQRPFEYYVKAVDCGRICVDGQKVDKDYVVHSSQCLSHFVHRHEPPVAAGSVTVLDETDDVITVCKPPSIPVHPCGQYRKNTVLGILQAEHKTGHLFPIHRLDRLVSGLLILAKNAATADCFRKEIEDCSIQKEYLAKVQGVFPPDEVLVDVAIVYNARDGRSTVQIAVPRNDDSMVDDKLIAGKHGKFFFHSVDDDVKGKPALTRFQRLSTDGAFSIVRCMPLTGRTHQIRVHLQHLGHPIANDALYLHKNPAKRSSQGTAADIAAKRPHGPNLSETSHALCNEKLADCEKSLDLSGGKSCSEVTVEPNAGKSQLEGAQVLSICCQASKTSSHSREDMSATCGPGTDLRSNHAASERQLQQDKILRNKLKVIESCDRELNQHILESGPIDFTLDPMCTNCPNLEPSGYEDPLEGLWLHCVRYSSSKWSYTCPLPNWAL
ncbi:hypothetical protein O6H91_13G076400 [Diphasiastrum complanatum]|uniref:Uncharacterized protein n=3 Tax=Diphasiastrum complanatum TaxID=34168 RepID=A0ACC2BW58_DIPCM|nr:hypothetical protein O6H91_13G076000 [Diphasiastrum complanatum]KAJ7534027.1 hypothetical protein O6H91_13G076000 [Diphasiastrum complanatum]KAJ7534035.1 hypothetical protein O6H91_13G076400 [Diphasiastrum complanatum]